MTRLKRILLITLATAFSLFLAGSFLTYIYKDKVKTIIVTEINKHLSAKITVKEISFSLLRHFPYASVEFINITAEEPKDFITTGNVLSAASLSLQFNFFSFFSDEYTLKKIVLKNASVNLQVDKDGNVNYEIWKKDTISSTGMKLELQEVLMENVNVFYYDALHFQDINFLVQSGMLDGDFNNDHYLLNTTAELSQADVIIDKVAYLNNRNCDLQLSLDVNKTSKTYTFKKSQLKLEGLVLAIEGSITDPGDYLDLDLKINSPKADIPSLMTLIPEKYKSGAKGYNYSGQVNFEGIINGRSGKKDIPFVSFTFKSSNVSLNPKETHYHLKNLSCNGFFTNRKNKANPVTYLKLEKFEALLEGKKITALIEIENFKRPRLNVVAGMDADLAAISRFFKPDTLEYISGNIKVDAVFKGIAGEKSTYYSAGDISLSNVQFKLKQKPLQFKNCNGLLHLDGNDLQVEKLNGIAGSTDFSLTGNFKNLFAWLLTENQKLDIIAQLSCNSVNLDELIAKDQQLSTRSDTVYRLNFSDKLRLNLDVEMQKLTFRKFTATTLSGKVLLDGKVLMTKDINFMTAGGSVALKGSIDDRPSDSLKINYNAELNGLNINTLFYEMGNFGQSELKDKNLKGIVTAAIDFRSTWSDRLEVNENSVYAKSNISIENGELINFEPMLALSRFLKGADLKTVRFSRLSNTIEIRNRIVYIPVMEIKSSALDLTASGEHSFDNIVDYKLRLYLSQLLGKKVREQNTEFGRIEDDGLGRPMVYLSMKGAVNAPKFAIDRKGVEQKITSEIKNESKNLKTILKEEFGNREAKKPLQQTKKKEELEIEDEE
jgi:hypothetical protein